MQCKYIIQLIYFEADLFVQIPTRYKLSFFEILFILKCEKLGHFLFSQQNTVNSYPWLKISYINFPIHWTLSIPNNGPNLKLLAIKLQNLFIKKGKLNKKKENSKLTKKLNLWKIKIKCFRMFEAFVGHI